MRCRLDTERTRLDRKMCCLPDSVLPSEIHGVEVKEIVTDPLRLTSIVPDFFRNGFRFLSRLPEDSCGHQNETDGQRRHR